MNTNKTTYNQYSSITINNMNNSYPWNNTIYNTNKTSQKSNNILLATGDCGLNGRIYISVNSNILNKSQKEKEEFKKKYNIMDKF